jgi:hypothetical protein
MKLKKQEDWTMWFKLGDRVMECVVIFGCIQMQLQTVLCYSYTYDVIFIP